MKRFTAAGVAFLLAFEIAAMSLGQLVAPAPAAALFGVDDLLLTGALSQAVASYGGAAAGATGWQAMNVGQRTGAAMASLLARMGVDVPKAINDGLYQAYAYVVATGMVLSDRWNKFVAAATGATAYGGYLWADLGAQGTTLNDTFAISQAAVGNVQAVYSSSSITDGGSFSYLGQPGWWGNGIAGALPATGAGGYTAAQLATIWALAKLTCTYGKYAPFNVTWIKTGQTSWKAQVWWASASDVVSFVADTWNPGSALRVLGSAGAISALLDRIATAVPDAGTGTVAAPAKVYTPTATDYPTNPDVLPIPEEADKPGIVSPTLPDVQSIDFPAPGDVVPWVPPLWLPKVPGLDLNAAKTGIDGIINDLGNVLPTDWQWILSPFTGILGGISAMLGWLDAFVDWLEQTIASVFSPSMELIQTEFKSRWDDLRNKVGNKWPFALGPLIGLIVDTFSGGGGGVGLDTSWDLDLMYGHYTIRLSDGLTPLQSLPWLRLTLVAAVWLWLAVAVYRLFRPEVVT